MRSLITAAAVVLMGLGIAGQALADNEVADHGAIEQRIRALVPGLDRLAIAETPVPGVMEVQIDSEILYLTNDGRYLLQGRMVDLDTQTDLTDAAKSVIRRELISELDDSEMVIFGPDQPDYELMVFTDVDCGYCRRLHQQIDDYAQAGIRVKYLAFPRAGIGSETYDKMVSIWCGEDPQSAMSIAKAGQIPPPATCESPVEAQYQLGRALGVTGTPSLITPDGEMIPGYVPPEQLRQRLDSLAVLRAQED